MRTLLICTLLLILPLKGWAGVVAPLSPHHPHAPAVQADSGHCPHAGGELDDVTKAGHERCPHLAMAMLPARVVADGAPMPDSAIAASPLPRPSHVMDVPRPPPDRRA